MRQKLNTGSSGLPAVTSSADVAPLSDEQTQRRAESLAELLRIRHEDPGAFRQYMETMGDPEFLSAKERALMKHELEKMKLGLYGTVAKSISAAVGAIGVVAVGGPEVIGPMALVATLVLALPRYLNHLKNKEAIRQQEYPDDLNAVKEILGYSSAATAKLTAKNTLVITHESNPQRKTVVVMTPTTGLDRFDDKNNWYMDPICITEYNGLEKKEFVSNSNEAERKIEASVRMALQRFFRKHTSAPIPVAGDLIQSKKVLAPPALR